MTAVYLDHAATTSIHPRAAEVLASELQRLGNASSLHDAGRAARRVVEESRELIAERLGAHPTEVVFTGGGTEADNLAVKGAYWARVGRDPGVRRVLVSAVEHHAVLDTAAWLAAREGATVVQLPVDGTGRVDLDELATELAAGPAALVSVMWANNEVGTVQPIPEVAAAARAAGVPVHSDAVQAVGQVPVDFAASGLDAMTLTGHKLGGPVGIGALLVRRDAELEPVQHGGGQERAVRSGTLPVALIRSFAVAVDEAVRAQADYARRVGVLRDQLIAGVLAAVPDAVLRGAPPDGPRLPGNAHFTFPGCTGEALLLLLDQAGIACSTGSACSAGVHRASNVLLAMGIPEPEALGAIRFSLGRPTTEGDVDAVVGVIAEVVQRARTASETK